MGTGPFFVRSRSLLLTGLGDVWRAPSIENPVESERSGLWLMAGSAFCFAAMAASVKLWLADTPAQAVVLSRGLLMTALFVALARRRRVPVFGRRTGMLIVRGLLGYGALSCYFWSVQHLPLGDAVLLQYSHPAFVALLAPLLLGERTPPAHWPLIAGALTGVALIVGPRGDLRSAAVIGLCGSLMSGLAYITIRGLSRTEHPLTILVWFPLTTIPGSLLASVREGASALPASASSVLGHLAVFVTAVLGQIALTAGLRRAGAARATAVSMSGPVFGWFLALALFGTRPSPASLAGTVLVVLCLALLGRAPVAPKPR